MTNYYYDSQSHEILSHIKRLVSPSHKLKDIYDTKRMENCRIKKLTSQIVTVTHCYSIDLKCVMKVLRTPLFLLQNFFEKVKLNFHLIYTSSNISILFLPEPPPLLYLTVVIQLNNASRSSGNTSGINWRVPSNIGYKQKQEFLS